MDYLVLVNLEDYDYGNAKKSNTNIFWHDYSNHGINLKKNDTVHIIGAGKMLEKWRVIGERKFLSVDDAMNDKMVYRFWKQNFEKYYNNSSGRFLELIRIEEATWEIFTKDIKNHSICEA